MTGIGCLPLELLIEIFAHVPEEEVQASCALVCTTWRAVALSRTPMHVPVRLLSADRAGELEAALAFSWNVGRGLGVKARCNADLDALRSHSQLAGIMI